MLRKLRPRSAYDVFGVLALFVALGGTAYAATGGNFILGQGNTASSTSSLTAPVAGKALQLTNPSTGSGASALGLTVDASKPPFTTNSSTKVDNLNADRLDGHDSSYFLPVFGKAADANALDGKDSTDFIQGHGRIETIDKTIPAVTEGAFLVGELPVLGAVIGVCDPTSGNTPVHGGVQVDAPDNNRVNVVGQSSSPAGVFHTALDPTFHINPLQLSGVGASGTLHFTIEAEGKVATFDIDSYIFNNPVLHQDECQYQGHAIIDPGS
jgi:hypothetical protein